MSQDIAESARLYCESRFEVGPSTVHRLSVTGEPYIMLSIGGIKPEGDVFPVAAADPKAGLDFFKQAFDQYASGKSGYLYWRRLPQLVEIDGGFQIAARLLISDALHVDFSTSKEAETCK